MPPRSRRNTARPSDRARRRARNPSRAAQWEDAVETLIELQQEFQEWLDNLPENLAGSTLAQKLDTICGLDLEQLRDVGALPETPGDATAENLDAVCNLDLSADTPRSCSASGETETVM